jgi:hypothetical protein
MPSEYRILKLRSGEEIIARIVGQEKGTMVIERPFLFKTAMMMDQLGRQREITTLRNWIGHSNQIQTKVPKDHIAMYLDPDDDTTHLYELEKEREDVNDRPKMIGPAEDLLDHMMNNSNNDQDDDSSGTLEELIHNLVNTDKQDMIDERIKNMLDSINENLNNDGIDDIQEHGDNLIDGPPEMEERDYVVMNMVFPASIINDMLKRGIISKDDLINMSQASDNEDIVEGNGEGFSEEYTGDDKDREDFGSKWTDWPWNLEDYLNDDNDNEDISNDNEEDN